MGDDTWMTVFPDSFAPNMSWPYDSFHVEDLHTVDEGVVRHLFPLLRQEHKSWDFILGHFLGVDHVGHRLGPDHPIMKSKLEQMDRVLRDVVEELDDETLLIVLGDHGMDSKGDHGGDGALETSAALWFYSKSRPLVNSKLELPEQYRTYRTYPSAPAPHRSVQQIDLVPSLSLLLGFPIPFNNLGAIIPELFWLDKGGSAFNKALRSNAVQIKNYLDTYRGTSAGGELDDAWDRLQNMWNIVSSSDPDLELPGLDIFVRLALTACRAMWAQFNVSLMVLGLTLLVAGSFASWSIYATLGRLGDDWTAWADKATLSFAQWGCIGAAASTAVYFATVPFVKLVGLLDLIVFGAFFGSSVAQVVASRSATVRSLSVSSVPVPLIMHTLAFMSNSFTFWEDHLSTFLLLSSIVPFVLVGFTAPTARLRYRILGFSALFAVCVRAIGVSTVCREEQQPYCEVTFFASSAITAPPDLIILLSIPTAIGLPFIVKQFLKISQSDKGIAAILLPWIFPSILLQGSAGWLLEWLDSAGILDSSWSAILRGARTAVGWLSVGGVLVLGGSLWYHVTLCIEVKAKSEQDGKREVTVIGFANLFGSAFSMFWFIAFSVIYATQQLTGQVILSLSAVALLSFLEVVDSVRDVRGMNLAFASSNPSQVLDPSSLQRTTASLGITFAEITPLALLGVHTFYGTGHQATIPTIQWKAAFVLTSKMYYVSSIILVSLNTFGPFLLASLATPLLALWNTEPLPHPQAATTARKSAIRAGVGVMLYYGTMLVGSALSSAWLRRHLMVWKVFAPRFMLAASSLLVVDLAVVIAVGLGVWRVEAALSRLLGAMPRMNEARTGKR